MKGRMCAGCPECLKESFPRGVTALRCVSPEAGSWKWRVTRVIKTEFIDVMPSWPPVWCPKSYETERL